jgi:hypothetical protein
MSHRLVASALVVAASLLAGCQSAKVAHFDKHHELGSSTVVVVEPFDMTNCAFVGDHGEHTAAEVQAALQTSLVRRLRDLGLAARSPAEGAPAPGDNVVRGEVLKCDAGSGTARYFAGAFGGGQSKLVCTANLFGGAETAAPAYALRIEGGSKGQGGIFGANYRTLADADDAAEQIANFLVGHRVGATP